MSYKEHIAYWEKYCSSCIQAERWLRTGLQVKHFRPCRITFGLKTCEFRGFENPPSMYRPKVEVQP